MRDQSVEVDVIDYIKNPPSRSNLKKCIQLLGVEPAEMLHRRSAAKLGDSPTDENAVLDLLMDHPEAMNRPIAICGQRALIASPAGRVLELCGT